MLNCLSAYVLKKERQSGRRIFRLLRHLSHMWPDKRGISLRIQLLHREWLLARDNREEPMISRHMTALIGITALVACIFAAQAQQAPDARVADLVQSGKLRIA